MTVCRHSINGSGIIYLEINSTACKFSDECIAIRMSTGVQIVDVGSFGENTRKNEAGIL